MCFALRLQFQGMSAKFEGVSSMPWGLHKRMEKVRNWIGLTFSSPRRTCMVKKPLLTLSLTFLTQIPCSRETRRKVGNTSKREACNFGKTEEIAWTNKTLNEFLHNFYLRFSRDLCDQMLVLWFLTVHSFDRRYKRSTALIAIPTCRHQLQAVDNFDSCCKLSTVLTAFTSFYQLWPLLQAVRSLHSSLLCS